MPCGLLGQPFIRKPVFMNNTPATLLTGLRVISKKKNIRRIFLLSTACYLLLYLLAISDLSFHSSPRSFAMVWSPQPFSILFKPISPFYFEAIALLELPFLTFLLSPINLLIGFALSLLVGVNIAFSYLTFTPASSLPRKANSRNFSFLTGPFSRFGLLWSSDTYCIGDPGFRGADCLLWMAYSNCRFAFSRHITFQRPPNELLLFRIASIKLCNQSP
jgi:hypothetical protein